MARKFAKETNTDNKELWEQEKTTGQEGRREPADTHLQRKNLKERPCTRYLGYLEARLQESMGMEGTIGEATAWTSQDIIKEIDRQAIHAKLWKEHGNGTRHNEYPIGIWVTIQTRREARTTMVINKRPHEWRRTPGRKQGQEGRETTATIVRRTADDMLMVHGESTMIEHEQEERVRRGERDMALYIVFNRKTNRAKRRTNTGETGEDLEITKIKAKKDTKTVVHYQRRDTGERKRVTTRESETWHQVKRTIAAETGIPRRNPRTTRQDGTELNNNDRVGETQDPPTADRPLQVGEPAKSSGPEQEEEEQNTGENDLEKQAEEQEESEQPQEQEETKTERQSEPRTEPRTRERKTNTEGRTRKERKKQKYKEKKRQRRRKEPEQKRQDEKEQDRQGQTKQINI
jgi:hypothetical protein